METALEGGVLRHFAIALVLTSCIGPLPGATLERLSLDDMIAQSTAIVRAKITGSFGQLHSSLIYTHYKLQVAERYKGSTAAVSEIIVPGGTVNGARQQVGGSPELTTGTEYVLFLWTGSSGYTQIIGLTQGLFTMDSATDADPTVVRKSSSEMMVDTTTGRTVRDQKLSMKLSVLKSRIAGSTRSSNSAKGSGQ